MPKEPLIVENKKDDEETWLVHPMPGLCVKFKESRFPSTSISTTIASSMKFFLNIAHCIEIPPPVQFLDEDTVARLLESDPNAFRIPICMSELDTAVDKDGNEAVKVDALVNSEFYQKCICQSEFFKQITIRMICEIIETKYGIHLDVSKQISLRNKKCMGELRMQQIRKRPLNSIMDLKTTGGSNILLECDNNGGDAQNMEDKTIDIDDIEETEPRKPRIFKIQIIKGNYMDIKVKVKDKEGEPVKDIKRLILKMNDDRIVILVDSLFAVADFFLPFRMKEEEAECAFDCSTSTIFIKCPVNWD